MLVQVLFNCNNTCWLLSLALPLILLQTVFRACSKAGSNMLRFLNTQKCVRFFEIFIKIMSNDTQLHSVNYTENILKEQDSVHMGAPPDITFTRKSHQLLQ